MFFGVIVRFPVLLVIGLVWVVYQVLRVALIVGAWLLMLLAPVVAAALVGWLGRLDARYVGGLETAAERHENGIEQRQERAARAALRLAR